MISVTASQQSLFKPMTKRAHDDLSCAVWFVPCIFSIHVLTPTLPLFQELIGRLIILLGASPSSLSSLITLSGLSFVVVVKG